MVNRLFCNIIFYDQGEFMIITKLLLSSHDLSLISFLGFHHHDDHHHDYFFFYFTNDEYIFDPKDDYDFFKDAINM